MHGKKQLKYLKVTNVLLNLVQQAGCGGEAILGRLGIPSDINELAHVTTAVASSV